MMLHVVGPAQEKQELEEKIRATVSDIIKNWGDEENLRSHGLQYDQGAVDALMKVLQWLGESDGQEDGAD